MSENRIDIVGFGLQEGREWFRAGWSLLAKEYRNYQRNRSAIGSYSSDSTMTSYLAMVDLVVTQLAAVCELPYEDVQFQVMELLASGYGIENSGDRP